jgi:HD superfamily phosphohydrolase
VSGFIDSACFQRLRNIIQTSYEPLYCAALHNRFIHSLGVYYLGRIAYQSVKNFLVNHGKDIRIGNISFLNSTFEELFSIACLLHDVGHAPFSHTGEVFYLELHDKNRKDLYSQLYSLVKNIKFKQDSEKRKKERKVAAPHEIMSVIVSLRSFAEFFKDKDKEFFARCILGYQYSDTTEYENKIKNCFISLLNSSIIDIDRLDYIIRDAFVSGYQNVSIDYTRLLEGLVIVNFNGKVQIAYHKSALSIIENVIFANDSERKWIQSHPVILYENNLIDYGIKKIVQYFEKNSYKLFQYEALTKAGNKYKNGFFLSLFSDDDIKYLMKNVCYDDFILEYFHRGARRQSLWKSEAEYVHLLKQYLPSDSWEKLINIIDTIDKYLRSPYENVLVYPIINNETYKKINRNINEVKKAIKICKNKKKIKELENLKLGYTKIKYYFQQFKDFAKKLELEFDFIVILVDMFKSTFSKLEIDDLLVWFPSTLTNAYMKKVSSFLDATHSSYNEQGNKVIFYFYYKKKKNITNLQKMFFDELCRNLLEIDSRF